MKIKWVAYYDPRNGTERMTTWIGKTEKFVVTGVPPEVWRSIGVSFEYAGAERHEIPAGANPRTYARELGGVLVTAFASKGDA